MATASIATVSGLHMGQYPFAIRRFVVAVVVDAVKRMTRGWAWTHIVIERLERLAPTLADSNSSASIARINVPAGILATLFHGFPGVVFRCAIHAVRGVGRPVPLGAVTTAGDDGPSPQQDARDGFFSAAVASANPLRGIRFGDSGESNQAAKPLICEIDDRWRHACHSTSCGA